MTENFLYVLEFAVQELLITQGNECAPPEYPLNAEFTFRTGVYVSIPEEDFGSVKDESAEANLRCPPPSPLRTCDNNQNKNGRCCLFALEKPIQENDKLMIRLYKKRTEKCKFLIGATEHKMKEMFDNVMIKFKKSNNGESSIIGGKRLSAGQDEELVITEEKLSGKLASGATNGGSKEQESNIEKSASAALSERSKSRRKSESGIAIDMQKEPPKKEIPVSETKKMGMPLYDLKGKVTGSVVVLIRLSCMGTTVCSTIPYPEKPQQNNVKSTCKPDCKAAATDVCPHTCPARLVDDQRPCGAIYGQKISFEGSSSESFNLSSSCLSSTEGESTASGAIIKPKVDKSVYDEFEADLNGCGLAIRVLKDAHKVSAVKRYEDPALCKICGPESGPNQKTAITRLLSLICHVLQSVTSDSKRSQSRRSLQNAQCSTNNKKPPSFEKLCKRIQAMIGDMDITNGNDNGYDNGNGGGTGKSCNCCKACKYNGRLNDNDNTKKHGSNLDKKKKCKSCGASKNSCSTPINYKSNLGYTSGRNGGGCECDQQQNIMLFLQSIRQVVSNKQGLSDLADLLLKCTCGDVKSKNQSSFESQQNIVCLVKQILELGVKYCSNQSIDLRNILCKILSKDICNKELTSLCRTICQYLEVDRNVICDHVRKETGGRVVNSSCLPKIRGNIKYPSNTDYGNNFTLPLPENCDNNNVEKYRQKKLQRECCVQIDGGNIDNTMQGINQTLPNGIELCRKGTIDHDSDVFILKMGKKDASSDKKGLIEIELKTPKGPTVEKVQTVSRDTQLDEDMLKERVSSAGGKSKGKKGKDKGKKGKKDKKGKK